MTFVKRSTRTFGAIFAVCLLGITALAVHGTNAASPLTAPLNAQAVCEKEGGTLAYPPLIGGSIVCDIPFHFGGTSFGQQLGGEMVGASVGYAGGKYATHAFGGSGRSALVAEGAAVVGVAVLGYVASNVSLPSRKLLSPSEACVVLYEQYGWIYDGTNNVCSFQPQP